MQRHDTNQSVLKSTRQSQAKVLARQTTLARTSNSIYRKTNQVARVVTKAQQENISEHQKTRDVLSAKFEDIVSKELAKFRTPLARSVFNRHVLFFGQRRDMIMAYLLLVKPQLEIVVRYLLSQATGYPLERHIAWLQSEFDNLLVSAAQEEASRHIQSTATPLDQWHYSEDVVCHQICPMKRQIEHLANTNDTARLAKESLARFVSKKASYGTQETFTHSFTFGNLRVHVPRRDVRPEHTTPNDGVGFTFSCGIGDLVHVINAQFYRDATQAADPKLCAQLNVFTVVESEAHYNNLFAHASAEGIENALRRGLISPYHINREGRNLCLYVSSSTPTYAHASPCRVFSLTIASTRLNTHERIYWSISTVRASVSQVSSESIASSSTSLLTRNSHDLSIVAGLFVRSIVDSDRSALEAFVDHMLRQVHDSSCFLFETTMNMLLWDYYKQRPRSLLKAQLHRLHREGLISHLPIWNDEPWDWNSVSSIIHPLFEHTAYIDTAGSLGRNRIQRCLAVLMYEGSPGDLTAVEEISNALIKAGVDVHHRDHDGLTPSMYARQTECWEGWCRALLRNGMCINSILTEEGTEWLAEEQWRETWKGKYGKL
jgi:hypothetical protein